MMINKKIYSHMFMRTVPGELMTIFTTNSIYFADLRIKDRNRLSLDTVVFVKVIHNK